MQNVHMVGRKLVNFENLLALDLCAVTRGPRVDYRFVIMKHDVLPAKFNNLIPLQIPLSPL